jgi:rhodanese-related sulfurtransferase
MNTITATELAARLQSSEAQPVLVDVREPHEFQFCRIPGSVNIPMNKLASALNTLERAQETVVICHHGMRSAQSGQFLIGNGFSNITNLKGGVAAWAAEVDPKMPTY